MRCTMSRKKGDGALLGGADGVEVDVQRRGPRSGWVAVATGEDDLVLAPGEAHGQDEDKDYGIPPPGDALGTSAGEEDSGNEPRHAEGEEDELTGEGEKAHERPGVSVTAR